MSCCDQTVFCALVSLRHQTHGSWFPVLCFSEHLGQKERLDTGTLERTGKLQTYTTTSSLPTEDAILLLFWKQEGDKDLAFPLAVLLEDLLLSRLNPSNSTDNVKMT